MYRTNLNLAQSLFQELTNSINTANDEIEEFRRLMTDEQRCQVFEYVRKRRTENLEFVKPWNVTEHPEWLDRDA